MNNIKAFIYKDMKRNATFKVLLMFIVGLFLSVNTFAQQIVVKGIVKDILQVNQLSGLML